MTRLFLITLLILFSVPSFANDGPAPPNTINTLQISAKVSKHIFKYMHFHITGVCIWWHCKPPHCGFSATPELDEYLPDLIVTVYNGKGNDPYWEAKTILDPAAYTTGNKIWQTLVSTNADLTNGNVGAVSANHYDAVRTKSVDVIGYPLYTLHIPYLTLASDTHAFLPYYQSDLDTLGRLGLAESLRPETWLPTGHYIGNSFINHWGYEFPRNLTVNVYNNYKASIITAQRAADIVTNQNTLHTNKSATNSCGDNCVVANVIEEPQDDHEIWQEVYPQDKYIRPGESDLGSVGSLGNAEDRAGQGNYIFVIWRHYQGCVQGDGRLVHASHDVGAPQRR